MPTKQVVIVGTLTYADEGGSGAPPGIWPSPGYPAHPIAPGGPPPGYWGGVAPPYPAHPIAPGGPPPGIWPSPGHPAHPIAPGGPPPVIWPGPGYPAHPIAPGGPGEGVGIWPSPGHPAHPIAPGGSPPGIWPSPGVPTHPIYLPIGEGGAQKKLEAKTAWTEQTGWMLVFVPTEEATVPTPAADSAPPPA